MADTLPLEGFEHLTEEPENKVFKGAGNNTSENVGQKVKKFVQDNGPALYGGAGALVGGLPGAAVGGALGKYVQNGATAKTVFPTMDELPGMGKQALIQGGIEGAGNLALPVVRGAASLAVRKPTQEGIEDTLRTAGDALEHTGLFKPTKGVGRVMSQKAGPMSEAMSTPIFNIPSKLRNVVTPANGIRALNPYEINNR